MFGKQRAGQSQVYPDFCHACMNKNPDMPETIVRMHASEMERSEIEPLQRNRTCRFLRSPQKFGRNECTVAEGFMIWKFWKRGGTI